jgi:hypothetical protein
MRVAVARAAIADRMTLYSSQRKRVGCQNRPGPPTSMGSLFDDDGEGAAPSLPAPPSRFVSFAK